jgi:hypothetical protein
MNSFSEELNFDRCQGNKTSDQDSESDDQDSESGDQDNDGGNQGDESGSLGNESDDQGNEINCQGNESCCQGNESGDQKKQSFHMTVYSLVFQLLEVMVERLEQALNYCEPHELTADKNPLSSGRNITESEEQELGCHDQLKMPQAKETLVESDCRHVQEILFKTLLQNPLFLKCFLFKFEGEKHKHAPVISLGLTSFIGNLLRTIVDMIRSGPQLDLIKPYMSLVCESAVDVITKATLTNGKCIFNN